MFEVPGQPAGMFEVPGQPGGMFEVPGHPGGMLLLLGHPAGRLCDPGHPTGMLVPGMLFPVAGAGAPGVAWAFAKVTALPFIWHTVPSGTFV